MVTYVHGKNAALLHGPIDLSPWVRDAKVEGKLDTSDTSHFGSNSKTYINGMNDGLLTFAGLYDGNKLVQQGVTGINEYMAGVLGSEQNGGNPVPVMLAPAGISAGAAAVGGLAKTVEYQINTIISDVNQINASTQLTGGFVAGSWLGALASFSTTGATNGTAVDDLAASTQGAFLTLHVPTNTRSTATTFKVQHSSDNSTWVDLFTFTVVSATTTSAQSTVLGPQTINRYTRLVATLTAGSGAITATATLSRY